MQPDVVEGTVVEESGTDVVLRTAPMSPTLFNTEDPTQVIERAVEAATPLAHIVKKQKLTVSISGKEHVRVEGWTLLGSMLGVFPVCVWTRKLDNGWEARVEARTRDGSVVGAAEAECLRTESLWSNRDDYALRSMAQTRATSKALRQPLGFVMQLAGFEATPAEEMPHDTTTPAEPLTSEQRSVWTWPSGKHQGKTLADTPLDYVQWYVDNGPKADVKAICADYLAAGPDDGVPF